MDGARGLHYKEAGCDSLLVCFVYGTACQLSWPAVLPLLPVSSPQVVVRELPKQWYKFLTTTCAVVGGVFTVAGIFDGILYTGLASMRNKVTLGKQG